MTQRDRGQKKMIYRTVTEEDGSKNTTTLRPADLHDDQNGPDIYLRRPFGSCHFGGRLAFDTALFSA
jgi:hypothetical protein